MTFCSDITKIIFGLIGDRVTLLSKELRKDYFGKNGIWIHMDRCGYESQFPLYFYPYSINLNFKGELDRYQNCIDVREIFEDKLICGFDSDGRLIQHVYKNTTFVSDTLIDYIVYFPNIRRVRKINLNYSTPIDRIISFVNNKKIEGFIFSGIKQQFLKLAESIDCRIHISTFDMPELRDNINEKIITINASKIRKDKTYPNLEKIIYTQNDLFNPDYGRLKFPKLRKIHIPIEFIEIISQKMDGITLVIKKKNEPVYLTETMYINIVNNNLKILFVFDERICSRLSMIGFGINYLDYLGFPDITFKYIPYAFCHIKPFVEIIKYYNIIIDLKNIKYRPTDQTIQYLSTDFIPGEDKLYFRKNPKFFHI